MGRFSKKSRVSKVEEVGELDLTSVLDVLMILLIYVLKSFNDSGVSNQIPAGLNIPYSTSRTSMEAGLNMYIFKDKAFLDKEFVIDIKDVDLVKNKKEITNKNKSNNNNFNNNSIINENTIIPLMQKLTKIKSDLNQNQNQNQNKNKSWQDRAIVNLYVDETTSYGVLKKFLYTFAKAEFYVFRFTIKETFRSNLNASLHSTIRQVPYYANYIIK